MIKMCAQVFLYYTLYKGTQLQGTFKYLQL